MCGKGLCDQSCPTYSFCLDPLFDPSTVVPDVINGWSSITLRHGFILVIHEPVGSIIAHYNWHVPGCSNTSDSLWSYCI